MAEVFENLFKKCCIIGLGLMGGSLGISLGKYNVVQERWGYDLIPEAQKRAVMEGAVDRYGDLEKCIHDAELVILALPVRSIIKYLSDIGPYLQQGTIVTDMGSTKREVICAMNAYLPTGVWGVGGHPMAGSDQSGIAAADHRLLINAPYILTPAKNTPRQAITTLEKMVRAINAQPFVMDAEEHDRIAALISHLPHFIAVTLCSFLSGHMQKKDLLLTLAGNGLKDSTRIAMGDANIWYDTFITNRFFLKESIKMFSDELNLLYNYLEQEDEEWLKSRLQLSAAWRKQMTRG